MIIMHSFSAAKKKYEKSHDKSHQKCISVLCHFYKQYKFVENYVFDIYSQKRIGKMNMCNADEAKLNFSTLTSHITWQYILVDKKQ